MQCILKYAIFLPQLHILRLYTIDSIDSINIVSTFFASKDTCYIYFDALKFLFYQYRLLLLIFLEPRERNDVTGAKQ